jgi:hypothetical protein
MTDELDEFWWAKFDLIEKAYIQRAESRGIDLGDEDLQVFADPFEIQLCENWKDGAFRRRPMSACPVRVRSRGLESKVK